MPEALFFAFAVRTLYRIGEHDLGAVMGVAVALHCILRAHRIAWLPRR